MKDFFFEFLEHDRESISQNLYGDDVEPFKNYPDLPLIMLEDNVDRYSELYKLLEKRESAESYNKNPLPLETLSRILSLSVGLKESKKGRRMYPSGGAKYPTEIYIVARNVENIEKAIYHYSVNLHGLVKINNFAEEKIYECFPMHQSNYPIFEAPVIIFMTFSKNRSVPKYGALAYKLGLIEVGHIGQNLYLAAEANNLNCRPNGGGNTQQINDLLNIDGVGESVVYTMSLGFTR